MPFFDVERATSRPPGRMTRASSANAFRVCTYVRGQCEHGRERGCEREREHEHGHESMSPCVSCGLMCGFGRNGGG